MATSKRQKQVIFFKSVKTKSRYYFENDLNCFVTKNVKEIQKIDKNRQNLRKKFFNSFK